MFRRYFIGLSNELVSPVIALGIWSIDLLMSQLNDHVESIWVMMDNDEFDTETWEKVFDIVTTKNNIRPPVWSVTASRWVGASWKNKAFDLYDCAWVSSIPGSWIETRVFNLSTLFNICSKRITSGTSIGKVVDRS